MFWVTNDFGDGFYGLAHSDGFLSSVGTQAGEVPRKDKGATVLTTTVISTMLLIMV
jgi:hypothetical protein